MRPALHILSLAALALVAACNGGQSSGDVVAANTTEVIAAENVTTSDAMVTNIDAAAPAGGDTAEELDAPIAGNTAGNAL